MGKVWAAIGCVIAIIVAAITAVTMAGPVDHETKTNGWSPHGLVVAMLIILVIIPCLCVIAWILVGRLDRALYDSAMREVAATAGPDWKPMGYEQTCRYIDEHRDVETTITTQRKVSG